MSNTYRSASLIMPWKLDKSSSLLLVSRSVSQVYRAWSYHPSQFFVHCSLPPDICEYSHYSCLCFISTLDLDKAKKHKQNNETTKWTGTHHLHCFCLSLEVHTKFLNIYISIQVQTQLFYTNRLIHLKHLSKKSWFCIIHKIFLHSHEEHICGLSFCINSFLLH